MNKFMLPAHLMRSAIRVDVIGAGGSGSHVINGLVQLHTALVSLGHPGGLAVRVIDDDTVSESNVGRQAFVWSDIGQPKAQVLVNRLNQAFGLAWTPVVDRIRFDPDRHQHHYPGQSDLVIGCVDNRTARDAIRRMYGPEYGRRLWLDLGNGVNEGQVVLGELSSRQDGRLPTVADLFPETVDPSLDATDDQPSCSLAEALEHQGLFVNRAMALHALNLLWLLLRHGQLEHHGLFVNLATGRTSPLAIDPAVWKRFGYTPPEADGVQH